MILTGCLLIVSLCRAATIHVPDDYATIQEAIDVSIHGDTVLVAAGTYLECIDFNGKAINLTSELGPRVTSIDARNSPASSVVTFQSGEGLDTVLEGFTIANGTGTAGWGGGIYCINHSSPLIRYNIIIDNEADKGMGGGVFLKESDFGRFTDNVVVNNYASLGGGVAVKGGAPIVANCIISFNVVFSDGGGCHLTDGAPILANCLLMFNETLYWDGGGVWCWNIPDGLIANCNILYNKVGDPTSWGGGIEVLANGPIITNCIVRDNQNMEISGSSLVTYSNVGGGYPGMGNIDAAPRFVDMDGPDGNINTWEDNDFHTQYDSPCRDAGNVVPGMPAHDMEGDPRSAGSAADIGMDEFHTHLYVVGDLSPGGAIEGKIIGLPGSYPTGLFIGSGILGSPISTLWGLFYLQAPWLLLGPLAPINSQGVLVLKSQLPLFPPAPYDVPMQAMVGMELSNLFVMEVR